MKLSAILAPLIAAKVPHEIIMQTVEAWEQQQTDALERRRANDRERQERRRHVKSRDVTVTVSSREGATRVEDNLQTKNLAGQEEKKDRAPAARTPCSELETVLDADRAKAVVDHRQRLRKPLTAHAAKLLAGKFAKVADPNAAADAMIGNGWQGFEPEWIDNRQTPQRSSTGPPRSRGPSPTDANRILTEMEHERQAQRDHEVAGILPPDGGQLRRADLLIRGAVNRPFD